MRKLIVAVLLVLAASAAHAAVLPLRQATLVAAKGPALYPYPGAANFINIIQSPKNAFNNAIWTKTNISDTTFATKTLAPDGTNTASKMLENTTNGAHSILESINRAASGAPYGYPMIITADAKAAERTRIVLAASDAPGSDGVYMVFDLLGGQIGVPAVTYGTGFTYLWSSITPIGNGFYRCSMAFTPTATIGVYPQINMDNASGTAALSQSYVGVNTNGFWLWQMSLLPAAAYKIGRQAFRDDFTYMSPDTGNTQGPGFNWYVGNWPNAVHQNAGNAWSTFTVTTAGDLSVSSGIMTISQDRSLLNGDLMSAAQNGAGRSFIAPALFRCSLSFDASTFQTTDSSGPNCMVISREMLDGSATNNVGAGSSEFLEMDFHEALAQSAGTLKDTSSTIDWTITGSGSGSTSATSSNNILTSYWPFTQSSWTSQHVISALWLSAASNGGVGLRQLYVDGIMVPNSEVTWTASGAAQPGATPSNPNGTFGIGDGQHMVFILGAGQPSRALNIDFAEVWQQ